MNKYLVNKNNLILIKFRRLNKARKSEMICQTCRILLLITNLINSINLLKPKIILFKNKIYQKIIKLNSKNFTKSYQITILNPKQNSINFYLFET